MVDQNIQGLATGEGRGGNGQVGAPGPPALPLVRFVIRFMFLYLLVYLYLPLRLLIVQCACLLDVAAGNRNELASAIG